MASILGGPVARIRRTSQVLTTTMSMHGPQSAGVEGAVDTRLQVIKTEHNIHMEHSTTPLVLSQNS